MFFDEHLNNSYIFFFLRGEYYNVTKGQNTVNFNFRANITGNSSCTSATALAYLVDNVQCIQIADISTENITLGPNNNGLYLNCLIFFFLFILF